MHIHILGICGTFMGSLALLARTLGYTVTGSDANVYPPMSTQLEDAGVTIEEGYLIQHLQPAPDLVVVGNAMKRGMEVIEYMLNEGMRYTSGPQFLSEQVLQSRHVITVAGTHGKTTTTTMLAWILHYAGIDAGFLIGGVPLVNTTDQRLQQVFAHSSYLSADNLSTNNSGTNNINKNNSAISQTENQTNKSSTTEYFVIEADEYDSAFFDKRSKFVHYRPRTAILNNLEFDHADIFADLNAIQTQFHHMIRMIPGTGKIIMPAATISLEDTLAKGVWTPIWRTTIIDKQAPNQPSAHNQKEVAETEHSDWQAQLISADGSQFKVSFNAQAEATGNVDWSMSGIHNVNNALVAVAAAYDVGVDVTTACAALSAFAGIKRRMELIGEANDILVFDDFAHHPTAISTTLDGAKKKLIGRRLWAIIEPRSNTMKMGVHQDSLAQSAILADQTLWYEPAGLEWGLKEVIERAISNDEVSDNQHVLDSIEAIIEHISVHAQANDAIVIMSNGSFEGIHQRLLTALSQLSS